MTALIRCSNLACAAHTKATQTATKSGFHSLPQGGSLGAKPSSEPVGSRGELGRNSLLMMAGKISKNPPNRDKFRHRVIILLACSNAPCDSRATTQSASGSQHRAPPKVHARLYIRPHEQRPHCACVVIPATRPCRKAPEAYREYKLRREPRLGRNCCGFGRDE